MDNSVVKSIVLLALPFVVFWGGAELMAKLSGKAEVTQRLSDHAEPKDRNGLGLRLFGYDSDAVSRQWVALDTATLKRERRSLELDLVFPFFYGGAVAIALLLAWATLNRPFHPVWLLLPVAITLVADWIENLVLLGQLTLFESSGKDGLRSGWVQIASAATTTKLVFFIGSSLLLIGLVGWMFGRGLASRS